MQLYLFEVKIKHKNDLVGQKKLYSWAKKHRRYGNW
jgi:hypothetical protein